MDRVAICPEDDRLSISYARPAPRLARYVTAYDAETGEQKWRWFSVPGDPSEPKFDVKNLSLLPGTEEPDLTRIDVALAAFGVGKGSASMAEAAP